MAFLSRDYPLWLAKKAMADKCDLGSVAVFGNSRAVAAVVPGIMPLPVSNLAMSSTGPIETYFVVDRALRCKTLPKAVIISHSLGHFGDDRDFWDEAPLLGSLDYAQLREIDAQAQRFKDESVRGLKDREGLPGAIRDWLYTARFPPLYFASLLNGYVGMRWWHNKNALVDATRSGGHALFGQFERSSDLADESKMSTFRLSPLTDYYFNKTLQLLSSRNVPTLFIAMPLNQSTYDKLNSKVHAGFQAYLQAKEDEFHGFHVLGDVISCWPDGFFGDAWHFNERGAEASTANWEPGWNAT